MLTNFAFGFVGLAVFMYMWIQFDKKAQYQKIFQSDGIIYARQIFNAWSWNINSLDLADQRQKTIGNEVLLLLKEDVIHEEVNKRTPKEKKSIQLKRALALVISFFILILGWVMIAAGSIGESAMQDYFLENTGNEFIGEWSATLVMTFVNYFIPWLISLVDELESWDFAFEQLYADLWKNFYTTMINMLLFIVLSLIDIMSVPKDEKTGEDLPIPEDPYNCKEDGLVDNFLKLLMSEIILRYAFYLYWNVYLKLKSCFVNGFEW